MSYLMLSNRLPIQWSDDEKRFIPSAGGLITAIKGLKSDTPFLWYGIISNDSALKSLESEKVSEEIGYRGICISNQLYNHYYNNFCNDVLWPLFHYEHTLVKYVPKYWDSYVEVNRIVADKIIMESPPGGQVWIHDFHFMLVPKMIKEKRSDIKVGFFLHIPFPSSEIFRQLPCRESLLSGMLAADLIGFHDLSYLNHFRTSLRRVLGVESTATSVELDSHTSNLGVFPISIDAHRFECILRNGNTKDRIDDLVLEKKEMIWVLGVDRLDYSKGLILKLRAFQKFLRLFPEWRGKVQLRQIVVPSRTDVHEYQKLKDRIDQLVGSINGEFGGTSYVPVLYQYTAINEELLVALYNSSDIIFINSRRDGMNLVCLEYVISQGIGGSGSVLLSEFTGAHSTLSGAFSINPWDTDRTAKVINKILKLPISQKKERIKSMQDFLRGYTSTVWANDFLSALNSGSNPKVAKRTKVLSEKELITEMKSKKMSHLFLDFDGTLEPIGNFPNLVKPSSQLISLLQKINQQMSFILCIVSGRDKSYFEEEFIQKGIYLHIASGHGADYYNPELKTWNKMAPQPGPWYEIVKNIFSMYTQRTPQSFIEEKSHGLAWHYRNSPNEFADFLARKLVLELEEVLASTDAIALMGKKVVEVKLSNVNKGNFVKWFLMNHPVDGVPIAFGDDLTDEDMFKVIQETKGLSIKVGAGVTSAGIRLIKQNDVVNVLSSFV